MPQPTHNGERFELDNPIDLPRAAAGDEFAAAQRNDFFQEAGGKGRADTGVKERQPLAIDGYLV